MHCYTKAKLHVPRYSIVIKKHTLDFINCMSAPINQRKTFFLSLSCMHRQPYYSCRNTLLDKKISFFVFLLLFHWPWVDENGNYLPAPSPNLEGKKKNLYHSQMSTELCCCHLIRDLIVIIMNKHTQLRLKTGL